MTNKRKTFEPGEIYELRNPVHGELKAVLEVEPVILRRRERTKSDWVRISDWKGTRSYVVWHDDRAGDYIMYNKKKLYAKGEEWVRSGLAPCTTQAGEGASGSSK